MKDISKATQQLKHTAIHSRHAVLGARMAPFAGYELPLYYSSILQEHLWVRAECGIFDVSHLGEIRVSGVASFPFLQKMIPTDLGKIGNGQILYTVFLNRQGGIMDDLLIYRQNINTFYLVINAASVAKIMKHLTAHAVPNVEIEDQSGDIACVAVQGPKSVALCDKILGGKPLPSRLSYYEFRPLPDWGSATWVSRTGYTGEDGFEVFSDNKTILEVWDALVTKGKKYGAKPAGLGARNTLRLEAGNILYGTDVDETKTPFEVRLQWLISDTKPDFFGKKILLERKAAGFRHRLCGFKTSARAVPRDGYGIFKDNRKVGAVTSGSFAPTLKYGIGLGYVEAALTNPGTGFEIEIHGRRAAAEVVKLPFVPSKHK